MTIASSNFTFFSNENASSTVQGDYPHHSQSLPHVLENLPPSEGNISSNTDSKNEQSKQDVQFPLVPQNSAVLNGPNYGLGIMSHMAGNQPVQFEGHDQQVQETRVSNLAVSCSILLLFMNFGLLFWFTLFRFVRFVFCLVLVNVGALLDLLNSPSVVNVVYFLSGFKTVILKL